MEFPKAPVSEAGFLSRLPRPVMWALLLAASAAVAYPLEEAGVPAALLLGPMLAGIVFALRGVSLRVQPAVYAFAQGLIGCLIAAALSADSLPAFTHNWPILVAAVLVTLAGSSLLGWAISHFRILPGTVGIWGSTPGAANAMVLMAEAFGADPRLVAFMQYFRAMVVTATAAIVARIALGAGGGAARAVEWFPAIDFVPFVATLLVAASGPILAGLLRTRLLTFIAPLVIGCALKFSGFLVLQLPEWLLAASYAAVGLSIGLRFTAQTIAQVRKALPFVALSVVLLIGFCALLGVLLSHLAGVDPLTAYLATSPGGMDAVAIIAAASSRVDISFVMAMQLLRFLIVLMLGPALARRVGRYMERRDRDL